MDGQVVNTLKNIIISNSKCSDKLVIGSVTSKQWSSEVWMLSLPELDENTILLSDLLDLSPLCCDTSNTGTRPGIVGRKNGADFCNRKNKWWLIKINFVSKKREWLYALSQPLCWRKNFMKNTVTWKPVYISRLGHNIQIASLVIPWLGCSSHWLSAVIDWIRRHKAVTLRIHSVTC